MSVPEMVQAAEAMPSVQRAVQELYAQGYMRVSQADNAKFSNGYTIVTLAFTDPAHPDYTPMVLVGGHDTPYGHITNVGTGVLQIDQSTGALSIPEAAPDAGFSEITIQDMASSSFDNYGVSPDHRTWRQRLQDWGACTGLGCAFALGICATAGGMLTWIPQVLASCTAALCLSVSYACLWY